MPDLPGDRRTAPGPGCGTGEPAARVVRSFADLAAEVLAAPPRLGPVRLVAVDGGAGSGKTTFAARLAAALNAQTVHTDDLLAGWADIVSFWPRLEAWVLEPLRSGRGGRFRRYDWQLAEFAEWHDVPAAPALVMEGVTAARAAIRPDLTVAVWVEASATVRLARGISRDGEALRSQWERWLSDEASHFAADRTAEHVDLVVDGDPHVAHDPTSQFVQLRPVARGPVRRSRGHGPVRF